MIRQRVIRQPVIDQRVMRQAKTRCKIAGALLCGAVLLACPAITLAQRHGGSTGGSSGGWLTRPDGVDDKDTLKGFHHAMEVQATSQQVAAFQVLMKTTEAAQASLEDFKHQQTAKKSVTEHTGDDALDKTLENARNGTKRFVEGFSDAQKSGLKEITKRLDKADSDLEQEEKKLDQTMQAASAAELAARAENLDKALTDFSNQQLALGREMGIILASGQDQTFNLPPVRSKANIANRNIGVTVSGSLSQVAVEGSRRTLKLELDADLSDLQQNITELLQAQLDRSDPCGERLAVRQAMLTPATPASVLFVRLHFERWICTGSSGQPSANELGEGEGDVELKLTPAVDKSNGLKLTAEFGRIDANAMMSDALRSGDLGDDLRAEATKSLLSAIQAGTDLKTALPPAVQGSVSVQSAKFQDAGAGNLSVVLEGQAQISDEQANQLAAQLNQVLSAQRTPQQ